MTDPTGIKDSISKELFIFRRHGRVQKVVCLFVFVFVFVCLFVCLFACFKFQSVCPVIKLYFSNVHVTIVA